MESTGRSLTTYFIGKACTAGNLDASARPYQHFYDLPYRANDLSIEITARFGSVPDGDPPASRAPTASLAR